MARNSKQSDFEYCHELTRISNCVTISEMIPAHVDWSTRLKIVRKFERRKSINQCRDEIEQEILKYGSHAISVTIPIDKYKSLYSEGNL